MKIKKVLIIRFSSFGDIVQCTSVVDRIRREYPSAQVDWLTKSEFSNLLSLKNNINHIWSFDKKHKLKGLIKLAFKLKQENYEFVYDAHNNVRSFVISLILRSRLTNRPKWVTRPKDRLKRILLFYFRCNLFPKPFRGISSYLIPIEKDLNLNLSTQNLQINWSFNESSNFNVRDILFDEESIVLVPSAAWEMKRWPVDHWKNLVILMPEKRFILLGGKEDLFCEQIKLIDPTRVVNLAGKLTLEESCYVINKSNLVISADTGLLHVADVLGKKALSLMGPTAFGFTTSPLIKTLAVDLKCRPCSKDGRGNCSQQVYQRCMVDITPQLVANEARHWLRENSFSSPITNG